MPKMKVSKFDLRTELFPHEVQKLNSELMKLEEFLKRSKHGYWARRVNKIRFTFMPEAKATHINYNFKSMRDFLLPMVLIAFALSGCAEAVSDDTKIDPMWASDGTQCWVLYHQGEPKGISCR